jgi:hypothetical protein
MFFSENDMLIDSTLLPGDSIFGIDATPLVQPYAFDQSQILGHPEIAEFISPFRK